MKNPILEKLIAMPNNSKKLLQDIDRILPILEKDSYDVTHAEALILLTVYNVSFHDSGKIEGICSCDSSCHGCTFCQKMCAAAKEDPEIICGMCYDDAQETRWKDTERRHMLNLAIMSHVLFTVDELRILPGSGIARINSSGDIENLTHARNMIRYAKAHPDSKVGIWSKNFPVVEKAFDIEGKPANVVYVASSPRINHPVKRPKYADYTFTVYSTPEKVVEALRRGACECNGKKCLECGFKCYFGMWPAGADIAELLRK